MNINEIENALITRYRNKIYKKFISGICQYELLKDGDVVGVCMSGGKDSFVLAKLFQEYEKHGGVKIKVKYLVMNPGFTEQNINALIENAKKLEIPIQIKESDVFKVAQNHGGDKPCYLCARMRRGFLYKFAHEEGCNKIALGHHFNDVIETNLLNVLYAGCFNTMLPKIKSANYPGMELIRPMIFIEEKDIINFIKYAEIQPMNCGCRVASGNISSKRREIKELIASMKLKFRDVDKSIFKSAENVNINSILGWKQGNQTFSFMDNYNDNVSDDEEL